MKTAGRRGRTSPAVAIVGALAAAWGSVAPALAAAPHAFGMVGVARQQTAVLNVVLTEPDGGDRGCRVVLSFVDARGRVLHDRAGNEVSQSFVLIGNVAASLHLRAVEVLGGGASRRSIRPVVSFPPETEGSTECTSLVATIEIVAQDGSTSLFDTIGEPCPADPPPPCPYRRILGDIIGH
jgi:hypothetical protein